jgi:hypothetical protein
VPHESDDLCDPDRDDHKDQEHRFDHRREQRGTPLASTKREVRRCGRCHERDRHRPRFPLRTFAGIASAQDRAEVPNGIIAYSPGAAWQSRTLYLPSFISTVRVRNSSRPTFSKECGVSGAPQTAVPRIGLDFDALVSASTFPSGSRRTKSLVARM